MTPLTGLSSLSSRVTNDTGAAPNWRLPQANVSVVSAAVADSKSTGAAPRSELAPVDVAAANASALRAFDSEPVGSLSSQAGLDASRVFRLLQDV